MVNDYDRQMNGVWNNLDKGQKIWLIKEISQGVEDVKGTCLSSYATTAPIAEKFEEIFGQLGIEDTCQDLFDIICAEQEIALCECCSWWVPTYELNSNNYCTDCDPTEEEE